MLIFNIILPLKSKKEIKTRYTIISCLLPLKPNVLNRGEYATSYFQ